MYTRESASGLVTISTLYFWKNAGKISRPLNAAMLGGFHEARIRFVAAVRDGVGEFMKLMGKVWNSLPKHERLTLLRHCKTVMGESIEQHESTLTWNKLWPLRQDELCEVDAETILGRELAP
jgi:hypothetical protein